MFACISRLYMIERVVIINTKIVQIAILPKGRSKNATWTNSGLPGRVSTMIPHSMSHQACPSPSPTRVGAGYVLTLDPCVIKVQEIGSSKEILFRDQEVD